jgi:hypothetical protein
MNETEIDETKRNEIEQNFWEMFGLILFNSAKMLF